MRAQTTHLGPASDPHPGCLLAMARALSGAKHKCRGRQTNPENQTANFQRQCQLEVNPCQRLRVQLMPVGVRWRLGSKRRPMVANHPRPVPRQPTRPNTSSKVVPSPQTHTGRNPSHPLPHGSRTWAPDHCAQPQHPCWSLLTPTTPTATPTPTPFKVHQCLPLSHPRRIGISWPPTEQWQGRRAITGGLPALRAHCVPPSWPFWTR